MTRVQAFPFHRPDPERVSAEEWIQGSAEDLPEALLHWDPNSPVEISRVVEIDPVGIKKDCWLAPDAVLRLAAVWHSPGTSLRGRGTFVDISVSQAPTPFTLNMKIDGTLLADRVRLETHLVLLDSGSEQLTLSPSRPGSLLWQDEKVVVLGGNASRFPVEVVDFKNLGWLPEKAAWYLDWDPEDLHQMALGGLRLFINARHEQVKQAITSDKPDAVSQLISGAIRWDVGRIMITGALRNEEFVQNADAYEDGTVGRSIKRLILTVFPNEPFETLRHRCLNETFKFECQLQEKLGLFRGSS